jgi:hypothetical protein
MKGVAHSHIGEATDMPQLQIAGPSGAAESTELLVDLPLDQLKEAWQQPLRW